MNKIIIVIAILIIVGLILAYVYINQNIYRFAEKINSIFTKYCHDPVVFNPKDFPWTENFRTNWQNIRNEYLDYVKTNVVPTHSEINSIVASCDKKNGWKTLYLRAFGIDTKIASQFPKTMELINTAPCTLAFFSVLEPGAKLVPHVGIYKGVIRYHLGLIIPTNWSKCFINVDGHVLNWLEGSDIMFDDMFIHYVQNNTNEPRVILFLDIKRDFHNYFLNKANDLFLKFIKSNDVLNDTVDNVNLFDCKEKVENIIV